MSDRHKARLIIRAGDKVSARVELSITSSGLVAVAVLVSAILLSTCALVGTAIRESHR